MNRRPLFGWFQLIGEPQGLKYCFGGSLAWGQILGRDLMLENLWLRHALRVFDFINLYLTVQISEDMWKVETLIIEGYIRLWCYSTHTSDIAFDFWIWTLSAPTMRDWGSQWGVMVASTYHLWWRWWSDTLWVTDTRLWLHSFLLCFFLVGWCWLTSYVFLMFVGQGFKIHTLVVDVQHCLQVLSAAIIFSYWRQDGFFGAFDESPDVALWSIKALKVH